MECCVCCGYKSEHLVENDYGDMFCYTCWDLKYRFPMKTHEEIGRLKPYYMTDADRAEASVKFTSRIVLAIVVIMIIIALLS